MYQMKKMSVSKFKTYRLKGDEFGLYDLKIITIHLDKSRKMVCNHPVGSGFVLRGENLYLPKRKPFSLYGLAALMPLLPAKQRMNHPMDWMETDPIVKCPDPGCGGAFKITRSGVTVFKNSQVSGVGGI